MAETQAWQFLTDNAGALGVIVAVITLLWAVFTYLKQRKSSNNVGSTTITTKNYVGKNNSGTIIQSGRDTNIGDQK